MATFATTDCGICLEAIVDAYLLDCGHAFCRGCINEYKKHGVNDVCPYCRAPLPPGFEYSLDQCHQMAARIKRYEADGDKKRVQIALRLQLHHAQKAVSADPTHAMGHFYLAHGLETVNHDSEGAIGECSAALRCDPNFAIAHFCLGLLLYEVRKDYDGAEREYREAIRCDPNLADTHCNLGFLLIDVREDYDGAEREFREAIRCDPNHVWVHSNLGYLLCDVRKDYDGAEHEYREAIRCDPDDADTHYNLGNLLKNVRKDYDGAEREYREALRCDPDDTDARDSLSAVIQLAAESAKTTTAAPSATSGNTQNKSKGKKKKGR
jgi:tetratricopeptide (TPR) repeat protein